MMTSESTAAQETKWPESAPTAHDDHFFSIDCGNSWLHWSFHSGMDKGGQPVLFWRTPLLNSEVINAGDLVESLAEHLPKVEPEHAANNGCSYYPRDHIFGKDTPPSSQAAVAETNSRKTKTSVYIVSSNDDQCNMLSKLFSTIPSRVFRMKGDDFFSTSQGRYDGMGTDQLAALSGAAHLHGFPALVFDSGTASKYTAADSKGHILGGGISPGIAMRFHSLHDGTFALPHINLENFLAELQAKSNKKQPISIFAKNTKEEIITGALNEMSNNARCVIRQWLEEVGPPTTIKDKQASFQKQMKNGRRSVLVTGGGAGVIEMLLKPDCGGLIEPSTPPGKEKDVKVMQVNNLIHFGITHVIIRRSSLKGNAEPSDNSSKKIQASRKRSRVENIQVKIGDRVAKYFGSDLYVGKITNTIKDSGLWHVTYDDGDEEDFDLDECNDGKKLYDEEMLKKGRK